MFRAMAYLEPKAYSEYCQTSMMEHFVKIAPKIKKVVIFSYISGKGNPEKISYIFSKGSCSYIPGKGNPEKNSLYFRK